MTNVAAGSVPQVRRFHAILLWPLQLVPVRESAGAPPWELLQRLGGPWRMARGAGCADLSGERQYSEFVSFLPYVQRCLSASHRALLERRRNLPSASSSATISRRPVSPLNAARRRS